MALHQFRAMGPVNHISKQFRHPLFIFGAAAIALFLGTISWLSWQNYQQDKALFSQRIQERLDNTANLVVTALRDKYTEIGEQLNDLASAIDIHPAETPGHLFEHFDNAGLVVFLEPNKLEAVPRQNLLYYPDGLIPGETNQIRFSQGERYEFQERNYTAAAEFYRGLVSSTDKATQAGALLRLGRVLRKQKDLESALSVYEQLADSGMDYVDGFPAELLARHARCAIFKEMEAHSALNQEAGLIWHGLQSAKWRLSRNTYEFYENEIIRWLEQDQSIVDPGTAASHNPVILSAGMEELWRRWQGVQQGIESPSGESNILIKDSSVFLMWRGNQNRIVALIALPAFLETEWLNPVVLSILESQGGNLVLLDKEGNRVWGNESETGNIKTFRTSAQAGLPWSLQVASVDPDSILSGLKTRQRLYWAWLTAMILLVLASGYATTRAIAKELKVARLQGDFVSAVSHEFRTPLASLCHMSELLVDGRVSSENRRTEYYRAMQRESERLHRLVAGLLDFRRMEEGAHEYRMEWLDTSSLVRNVAEEFARETKTKGYSVDIDVQDSLPEVHADKEALSRAIWNLLDNAVKYSPDCMTVWIQASCIDDQVYIQVRDHGVGIAEGEHEQIFVKFFRADSAKTANIKGTGLGLAMVKHIVDDHGGKMLLESRLDEGSTFTINLPVERRLT